MEARPEQKPEKKKEGQTGKLVRYVLGGLGIMFVVGAVVAALLRKLWS